MAGAIDLSEVLQYDAEGGFEYDLFKKEDAERLKCGLCPGVVREAMHMTCGCLYCSSCINKYMMDQEDVIKCPSCEEEFESGVISPNIFIRKEVDHTLVACPRCSREDLEFKDLVCHLNDECQYAVCPHKDLGCQAVMLREEMDNHAIGCLFDPIECRYCGNGTTKDRMKKHQRYCKKKKQPCPNKCGAGKIHVSKLENHLKAECPLSQVDCEYKKHGCPFKNTRRCMVDHMKSAASEHRLLDVISGRIRSMEMAYRDQSETVKSLKCKVAELEDMRAANEQHYIDQSDTVRSLKRKVAVLEDTVAKNCCLKR